VYYFAHVGVSNDATILDQLDTVKRYFTHLGYGINITTNENTATIRWNVSW
jgi:hypothetical protein